MESPNRTRDPQPIGRAGEVALLAALTVAGVLAGAALTGLGLACAVAGRGWVWPSSAAAVATLAGLLTGHPGRGLPATSATSVPNPAAVYTAVGLLEALTVVGLVRVGLLLARRLRPDDPRRGMATRAQARLVLGRGRLRRARRELRPDLSTAAEGRSPGRRPSARVDPTQLGWRLGRSSAPRGVELWVRHDRTAGVIGAQGSGKTLDLLAPALLSHPGSALVTLTKPDDLLLTIGRRARVGPVAVLDPFGVAPGLPELLWDPVVGCDDPMTAERRARAFAAGTITKATSDGRTDSAARFYAGETAKVLGGFLHAAALADRTLDDVIGWVARPAAADEPAEILRHHPRAARYWDGLLAGALDGAGDTVANTVTTVQQAFALFFQPALRSRCVPAPGRPGTDLASLIAANGTVYLLCREDPYTSASPLMTAAAEHVLDTALGIATSGVHARITPPFLACLDELPSTAPLPTLRVRMANERALGLSFVWAAQTWRQLVVCYGEDEARSLLGLTNTLVVFGGGKDIAFYKEISDLVGATRITRQTLSEHPGGGVGTNQAGEDAVVLRPEQLRLLPERHALVVAENAAPIIARLTRCIEHRAGRALLAEQAAARDRVADARRQRRDAPVGQPAGWTR